MLIKSLKKPDQSKLKEFFIGLSPETLYNWNRFGNVKNKKIAGEMALRQVNKPLREEKGFVALNDQREIMGYGYLRYFPEKKQKRYTTSVGVVVGNKFQGQGVGTTLVGYMIEDAKKNGMRKIWLATYSDNKRAIKLYQRFGFDIEGVFMADEYFGGKPRHVVSMALFLGKSIKDVSMAREKLIKRLAP